jgi:hypothetical protein
MQGLFFVKFDKFFEILDASALQAEDRQVLFQGIKYDPAVHCVCRLPIQIEGVQTAKRSARFRRRKGYENVSEALIKASVESPKFRLLGVLPNSTSVDGEQANTFSEEALFEINLGPVGKLHISGKADQAFRRKQRTIIASRTSREAQWAFQKLYLRDNLGFTLIFLFEKQGEGTDGQVRVKFSFLDKGRDIFSPRPKVVNIPPAGSGKKKN